MITTSLIKSIAAIIVDNNIIEPQKNIEMHFLEQAAIKACWAIQEAKKKVPDKPDQQTEHNWLIEFGAEYVKQKRAEWQSIYDTHKPLIDAAEKAFQEADAYWNSHSQLCVANGINPDTHEGDANLNLKKP